jgi:uncharacterized membrane protein YqaE (UPF0057 family)
MRKGFFIFFAALVLLPGIPTLSSASSIVNPSSSHPIEPDRSIVKAALEAFKTLPKKTQKARLKEVKKAIKEFKAAKKAGKEPDTNTLLLVILALLLPPLAVYLHQGETNSKFWITLLLFVLGLAGVFLFSFFLIFAAVVYALIVILGGA